MGWRTESAMFLFYFAGLLFWPLFQLLHWHWTACAKRLLMVFVLTLVALVNLLHTVFWLLRASQFAGMAPLPGLQRSFFIRVYYHLHR